MKTKTLPAFNRDLLDGLDRCEPWQVIFYHLANMADNQVRVVIEEATP